MERLSRLAQVRSRLWHNMKMAQRTDMQTSQLLHGQANSFSEIEWVVFYLKQISQLLHGWVDSLRKNRRLKITNHIDKLAHEAGKLILLVDTK